jgi:hypothetical protein
MHGKTWVRQVPCRRCGRMLPVGRAAEAVPHCLNVIDCLRRRRRRRRAQWLRERGLTWAAVGARLDPPVDAGTAMRTAGASE